jgi:hypothetical protein
VSTPIDAGTTETSNDALPERCNIGNAANSPQHKEHIAETTDTPRYVRDVKLLIAAAGPLDKLYVMTAVANNTPFPPSPSFAPILFLRNN